MKNCQKKKKMNLAYIPRYQYGEKNKRNGIMVSLKKCRGTKKKSKNHPKMITKETEYA